MPAFRGATEAASGAASFTCARPGAVVAGDILVAIQGASSGTAATMGVPTGGATWDLLTSRAGELSGEDGAIKIWWKRAGAEPTSYGFTQPASSWPGAVSIVAAQAAPTDIPIVAQIGGEMGGLSSLATPSTIPNGANDLEIRCAVDLSPQAEMSWTSPAGFTERTDIQSSWGVTMSAAVRTLSSSGATGVFYFTPSTLAYRRHGFTINIGTPIPRVFWGARITF